MKSIYSPKIAKSRQREVFCLYGDLKNFSKISRYCLSERISIDNMRVFYETTLHSITSNSGILLCFMGDGFLAVWDKNASASSLRNVLKEITTKTAELSIKWRKNASSDFKRDLGIRFGGNIANITMYLNENNQILNSFGNQLNLGARLLASKENKNNCICLTEPALEWLKPSERKPVSHSLINVKGDKIQGFVIPISYI